MKDPRFAQADAQTNCQAAPTVLKVCLTRRQACALAMLGFAGLGAGGLSAWADAADGTSGQAQAGSDASSDVDVASGATKTAASADPASGDAAAPGTVAEHVAVPDDARDVPEAAVDPTLPLALTDDQGRQVEVSSLDGVVACMGSFAKVWQLAGGSLVGVTDDALDDYDLDGADGLALVGDFTSPNLEQILALSPTLVVMSASSAGRGGQSSQTDLVDPLEAAGVPVLTFKVTLFGDYLRMLRVCCSLTGRYDLYRENGLATADRIDEVLAAAAAARQAQGPKAQATTCLIMTNYSGGTRVLNASSQAGAIAADLGALNLADDNPSLLQDFSLESVVALDPDFIFALPMGDDAEAAQRALEDQTTANPAWAGLTAVREGRYQALDPKLFQYKPLEAWDEAYRVMAKALYGDGVCA